jgi:hypothetical protein
MRPSKDLCDNVAAGYDRWNNSKLATRNNKWLIRSVAGRRIFPRNSKCATLIEHRYRGFFKGLVRGLVHVAFFPVIGDVQAL